jgi:NADPH-dependent 2,4-dienoyl-CoA reductase/sulfur reductase-like enzyme
VNKVQTDNLIVGGGAAGLSAALSASENGADVTLVDDNPHLGGQIWRAELGKTKSRDAIKLITDVESGRIKIVNNAQVFAVENLNCLAAETPEGRVEFAYKKLILATGARELFLPFPGWTLSNVFGAGGLQALAKGGLDIRSKRIVIAGTGPLLLAVAEYLRSKGAYVVAIAEQTSAAKLRRFAVTLFRTPQKLIQGVHLRKKLLGIPYLTDCWVARADGHERLESVTLTRRDRTWSVECDILACGFHLVPNLELASLLGCRIETGFVAVDAFQKTSCENTFCAGEPTGIGGVEKSLIEGRIAGHAASGNEERARELFAKRNKAREFGDALNEAFALRSELRSLADDETMICRCEDVKMARLRGFDAWREAKLQTRCGMGACQGRICGGATEFLFGWQRDAVRPPIFPVKMENL